MQNCISTVLNAPINHIKGLKQYTLSELVLKNTKYSPAYIIMLITSLLTLIMFQAYIIYYVFTNPAHPCLVNISIGVDCLSILYLVESLIIFICIAGIIGTTSAHIVKIIFIVLFSWLVTGFGFGGLGVAYICVLDYDYPTFLHDSFVTQNQFIQAMVYIYLSFILIYFIIGPIFKCCHQNRLKKQQELKQYKQRSCCDIFLCILHYFIQVLLLLTCLFVAFITLLGPLQLLACLVQIARAIHYSSSSQAQIIFFVFGILSLFLPLLIFFISLIISCLCCKPKDQPMPNGEIQTQILVSNNKQNEQKNQRSSVSSYKRDTLLVNGNNQNQRISNSFL